MKFRKGDEIKIIAGKDKGKTGKIDKVYSKKSLVFVQGINTYKRHSKARDEKHPAGIIDIVKPIPFARIALVCPKCKQPTRAGFIFEDGKKIRICRKCESRMMG